MGLVQLLDESENGKAANSYDFLLAGSADEITPKLIQGEIDIAAVPVNLASVLYSKTNGALELNPERLAHGWPPLSHIANCC